MIQDWLYNPDDTLSRNILINGYGRNIRNNTDRKFPTHYSTFSVVRGGRYRFRVISNGM